MPELGPQERLQPSLLDRLTDDEPEKNQETRDQRVLSLRRLREAVRRDLTWLLNTGNLASLQDLSDYPGVAGSVVNYGIRDLTGTAAAGADPATLERMLRQAIWDFEPRILHHSVKVKTVAAPDGAAHNAVTFLIEGELWAQPLPLHLYLKTEIDLESADVRVTEYSGPGPA